MAFWLRGTIIAAAFVVCCSCEKHPLGQMPEVQREQVDPAKVWSNADKRESEKSASSPTPAEHVPDEAR
ncbi:MAG: hypothetical protein DME85_03960 [Verrucomicrobia bacterium]|nr:MAG: hypothetical protein DME85_03960 [Verrucomicrobiota bacterium]